MRPKSDLAARVTRLNSAMVSASALPNREQAMLAVLRSGDCYYVACAYALRFVSSAAGIDRAEAAHDLAVRVLAPMFRKPGSFQGKSLFSTYLFGSIRRSNSKCFDDKLPAPIKRIHSLAPLVFELIARDLWRDEELRPYLRSFMAAQEVEELILAVREEMAKDAPYYRNCFGVGTFSDLASIEDGEESFEARFADPLAVDPLDRLLDEHQSSVLQTLLGRLGPDQRQLVEEYVFSRRSKTYREAAKNLGIKNPAYELKKIGKKLREMKKDFE